LTTAFVMSMFLANSWSWWLPNLWVATSGSIAWVKLSELSYRCITSRWLLKSPPTTIAAFASYRRMSLTTSQTR
jgi:hypothetical protein